MPPTPAQYLLRFDDLCPTVSALRWRACVALIEEFHLHPILAVVPDNRDPDLCVSPPDPDFWNHLGALETAGAVIALHGYRHLCLSRGRSLLPLHAQSEFAGVPAPTQRAWIREGLDLLRAHSLNPRLWVAPRHGFDAVTLAALRDEGILLLSDGLARRPFLANGLTWIPQQLWAPVERPSGLWTLCLHPNTLAGSHLAALRAFLNRNAAHFTSVDRALAEFLPTPLTLAERFAARLALGRMRASRAAKNLRAPASGHPSSPSPAESQPASDPPRREPI
jgi:peptidoglycan/xylan/chitin deacetylase (PgdA/CDA1 family)